MCLTPVKTKAGDIVPCGVCAECIQLHRSDWFVRLMNQAKSSTYCYFVTMTYDDDHLVYADDLPVLHYRHVQLFHKLARKKAHSYKYFLVGEYGERSFRPHYHMLVFSNSLDDDGINFMLSLWKYGNYHIGRVTGASINYCLKDMLKERTWFKGCDNQFRPKLLCSKGLGMTYVESMVKWHKADYLNRTYVVVDGSKRHMPRIYRDRMFSKYQRSKQNYEVKKKLYEDQLLSPFLTHEERQKYERKLRVYTQFVEQRRSKQLSIRHHNKSL